MSQCNRSEHIDLHFHILDYWLTSNWSSISSTLQLPSHLLYNIHLNFPCLLDWILFECHMNVLQYFNFIVMKFIKKINALYIKDISKVKGFVKEQKLGKYIVFTYIKGIFYPIFCDLVRIFFRSFYNFFIILQDEEGIFRRDAYKFATLVPKYLQFGTMKLIIAVLELSQIKKQIYYSKLLNAFKCWLAYLEIL